ncbi:hypothetical protein JHU04_001387 [Brenneria sp. 4F2]|nr:hypothetical protein [Brenneria bubanii]
MLALQSLTVFYRADSVITGNVNKTLIKIGGAEHGDIETKAVMLISIVLSAKIGFIFKLDF